MHFVRENFLEFGWPARSRATLRRRARRGEFGPAYVIPGSRRSKHFALTTVEGALGELTQEKRVDALRRYEAARRLPRAPILECVESELEIL